MSDKSSESFEEWFNESKPKFQKRLPIEESIARRAWNARGEIEQKKIDELEEILTFRENKEFDRINNLKVAHGRKAKDYKEKLQAAEKENKILRKAVEEFSQCDCNCVLCSILTKIVLEKLKELEELEGEE